MKLFFAAITLFFSVCIVHAQTYKTTLDFGKKTDISSVYLYHNFGGLEFIKDTLKVKKGKVSIEQKKDFVQGLYTIALDEKRKTALVLAGENFTVEFTVTETELKATWDKSANNDFYIAYKQEELNYNTSLSALEKDFATYQRTYANNQTVFEEKVNGLRLKVDTLRLNRNNFLITNSKTNSPFIKEVCNLLMLNDSIAPADFLKTEEFTESMATGEFLSFKIQRYAMEYTRLTQENIALEATQILGKAPKNTWARQVTYFNIIRICLSLNESLARQFLKAFEYEFPNAEMPVRVKDMLPKAPIQIGDKAPEIEIMDTNGQMRKLSDLKGKVVLVDFWASWCRPCRMENPNVVRIYHKYHDKGFEVFSVSLDRNRDSWLKAIEKDGLIWDNHVSELKHWDSEAARAYSVTGIPNTFLIDENGIIINKNLRGEALENTLQSLFGAK